MPQDTLLSYAWVEIKNSMSVCFQHQCREAAPPTRAAPAHWLQISLPPSHFVHRGSCPSRTPYASHFAIRVLHAVGIMYDRAICRSDGCCNAACRGTKVAAALLRGCQGSSSLKVLPVTRPSCPSASMAFTFWEVRSSADYTERTGGRWGCSSVPLGLRRSCLVAQRHVDHVAEEDEPAYEHHGLPGPVLCVLLDAHRPR